MKNKNLLTIILGIIALVLIGLVGMTMINEPDDDAPDSSEDTAGDRSDIITVDGKKYKLNSDLECILFLGVDKEAITEVDNIPGTNGQSDSLNLLILDKKQKTGQIMQINRDSMVDLELYTSSGEKLAYQRGQICLQYAYGSTDSQGSQLVVNKVSELLFNINIKDYVTLTLDGIVQAADSLGGVEITIPEDYTYIDPAFVEGETILLTGEQAERYVRYRNTEELDSNIPRMERQAQFMEALIMQLQSSDDIERYTAVYQDLEPYMETNLTAEEMKELSEYEISMEMIEIPGEIMKEDGYAQFIVDNGKLQEIVLKTFYKSY